MNTYCLKLSLNNMLKMCLNIEVLLSKNFKKITNFEDIKKLFAKKIN